MAENKATTKAPAEDKSVTEAVEKAKLAFPAPGEIKAALPVGEDGGPATIDNPAKEEQPKRRR